MKILICGDLIVYGSNSHLSKDMFGEFQTVIQSSDIAIYNQEFPVTKSTEVYSTKRFGLTAATDPDLIRLISQAGFNYASIANNHIFNRGDSGLKDTIANLKKHGITTFGAGVDLESAKEILYVNKSSMTIAFLNFAENEFNSATDHHGGSNPLNIVDNVRQIRAAQQNADFVFVIIHGGIDYCSIPSPRVVNLYRFYAESGASAIIGHHSHVVSGYEVYNDVPIFYGIGNLIPGKIVIEECLYSYPVEFTITGKKKILFNGYPLKFNEKLKKVELLKEDNLEQFNNKQKNISESLNDGERLKTLIVDSFLNIEKRCYYYTMFTGSNYFLFRLFKKLKILRYYYYYIRKKMKLNKKNSITWNLYRCESHNDVLDIIYEKFIDIYPRLK